MAREVTTPARGNPRRSGGVLALLAVLAAGAVLTLGPGAATAGAACPHANSRPHDTSLRKLRAAMVCLINNQRHKRDRHELSPDRHLRRAAQRHTDVMLAKDCLKHRCPNEPSLARRVNRSGYLNGARNASFAEVLGYESTPREMVNRLLRRKASRRRMLDGSFRDVGVGAGRGTPVEGLGDGKFVTYTLIFAWRRPR